MGQPEPQQNRDDAVGPQEHRRGRSPSADCSFEPPSKEHAERLAAALRAHFDTVWRTARRLGMAPLRADEIAQEAFLTFARKLDQVEPRCERRYLVSVAVRLVANERRLRATQVEVAEEWLTIEHPDPSPSAEELLELKRLRCLLDELILRMPAELGTVFVLFELEGISGPEIAELLGIPEGTVASRLRRAREAFHKGLRGLGARTPNGGVEP
jgi:RNA polymerase sigma-70 factor (ECF subfamily)